MCSPTLRGPAYDDSPSAMFPEQEFHQPLGKAQVETGGRIALVEAFSFVDGDKAFMPLEGNGEGNAVSAAPHGI